MPFRVEALGPKLEENKMNTFKHAMNVFAAFAPILFNITLKNLLTCTTKKFVPGKARHLDIFTLL
jgi:hypothetical protein